jgi:glycosyltransferase involved in cell wall biosynthesis
MKILFYIESLRAGGKERRLVELIKGLKRYPDIEMELVLTREDIHYTDIFKTGIKIHYTVRKGLKKDPRLFWKFYRIAKQFKPDIIHVWGNMVAIYAIPAKVLLGVPMINNQITEVPINIKGRRLFNSFAFRFSDLILSNTNAGIEKFKVSRNKSKCIYNGFDFKRLEVVTDSEDVRQNFHIQTKYLVGMVATFSTFKDYQSYISAALQICQRREDVSFLCVGNGDSSFYQKQIPKKLKTKIIFTGPQKQVEAIMNACDIGVLASFTEGISNTLMEFMALGKPVIATGEGGTKELIQNNNNGIHIPAKHPTILAEKIELLLDHPDLRADLGHNAKVTIQDNFNIAKMIESFLKEYKDLCAE